MSTVLPWSGRRRQRIAQVVLHVKGTTCHLCGLPGATSPDHDPPRSVLIARGVADPDALEYLFPSHLICNQRRSAREITDELRTELRRRYLAEHGPVVDAATLSPRFARRRHLFAAATSGRTDLRPSIPGGPTKNGAPR